MNEDMRVTRICMLSASPGHSDGAICDNNENTDQFYDLCRQPNGPRGLGPDFIGGVKNVTVPEGRDVILSCTVVRLGTHKVQGVPKNARLRYFGHYIAS